MPYRENAKEKLPLFYVHISYSDSKDGSAKANQSWIRAKDSFKALQVLIKQCNTTPNNIWSQHVITRQDFEDKELEIE